MITLSKTEIGWIIGALKESVEENRRYADDEDVVQVFRAMYNLRAENLSVVIEKLYEAYSSDHKRIAIR